MVDQLPNVEGNILQAKVFADGRGGAPVVPIDSWDKSSLEGRQDDFEFSWTIPRNIKGGRYYVKMVQGEDGSDSDDNDPCRSYSFYINPSPQYSSGGGNGGGNGSGGYNSHRNGGSRNSYNGNNNHHRQGKSSSYSSSKTNNFSNTNNDNSHQSSGGPLSNILKRRFSV